MKTLLINASPKKGESSSRCLLQMIQAELGGAAEQIELHGEQVPQDAVDKFTRSDRWVFFFPLYIDALPSHLLSCLVEMAASAQDFGPAVVYGVVNCGFFEGEQTRYAFEVLSNWAASAGLQYGGGLGIGGGGAVRSLPQKSAGPLGPTLKQLAVMADRLRRPDSEPETRYVDLAMPRWLYKTVGEIDWRHQIRQNGGRRKDLWNRPGEENSASRR